MSATAFGVYGYDDEWTQTDNVYSSHGEKRSNEQRQENDLLQELSHEASEAKLQLAEQKELTERYKTELKRLRDEISIKDSAFERDLQQLKGQNVKELAAERQRCDVEMKAQDSQVLQLQKDNNRLVWSLQELSDRIAAFESSNEYELFGEQMKESDALIVALRGENDRLQKSLDTIEEVVLSEISSTDSNKVSGWTGDDLAKKISKFIITAKDSSFQLENRLSSLALIVHADFPQTDNKILYESISSIDSIENSILSIVQRASHLESIFRELSMNILQTVPSGADFELIASKINYQVNELKGRCNDLEKEMILIQEMHRSELQDAKDRVADEIKIQMDGKLIEIESKYDMAVVRARESEKALKSATAEVERLGLHIHEKDKSAKRDIDLLNVKHAKEISLQNEDHFRQFSLNTSKIEVLEQENRDMKMRCKELEDSLQTCKSCKHCLVYSGKIDEYNGIIDALNKKISHYGVFYSKLKSLWTENEPIITAEFSDEEQSLLQNVHLASEIEKAIYSIAGAYGIDCQSLGMGPVDKLRSIQAIQNEVSKHVHDVRISVDNLSSQLIGDSSEIEMDIFSVTEYALRIIQELQEDKIETDKRIIAMEEQFITERQSAAEMHKLALAQLSELSDTILELKEQASAAQDALEQEIQQTEWLREELRKKGDAAEHTYAALCQKYADELHHLNRELNSKNDEVVKLQMDNDDLLMSIKNFERIATLDVHCKECDYRKKRSDENATMISELQKQVNHQQTIIDDVTAVLHSVKDVRLQNPSENLAIQVERLVNDINALGEWRKKLHKIFEQLEINCSSSPSQNSDLDLLNLISVWGSDLTLRLNEMEFSVNNLKVYLFDNSFELSDVDSVLTAVLNKVRAMENEKLELLRQLDEAQHNHDHFFPSNSLNEYDQSNVASIEIFNAAAENSGTGSSNASAQDYFDKSVPANTGVLINQETSYPSGHGNENGKIDETVLTLEQVEIQELHTYYEVEIENMITEKLHLAHELKNLENQINELQAEKDEVGKNMDTLTQMFNTLHADLRTLKNAILQTDPVNTEDNSNREDELEISHCLIMLANFKISMEKANLDLYDARAAIETISAQQQKSTSNNSEMINSLQLEASNLHSENLKLNEQLYDMTMENRCLKKELEMKCVAENSILKGQHELLINIGKLQTKYEFLQQHCDKLQQANQGAIDDQETIQLREDILQLTQKQAKSQRMSKVLHQWQQLYMHENERRMRDEFERTLKTATQSTSRNFSGLSEPHKVILSRAIATLPHAQKLATSPPFPELPVFSVDYALKRLTACQDELARVDEHRKEMVIPTINSGLEEKPSAENQNINPQSCNGVTNCTIAPACDCENVGIMKTDLESTIRRLQDKLDRALNDLEFARDTVGGLQNERHELQNEYEVIACELERISKENDDLKSVKMNLSDIRLVQKESFSQNENVVQGYELKKTAHNIWQFMFLKSVSCGVVFCLLAIVYDSSVTRVGCS